MKKGTQNPQRPLRPGKAILQGAVITLNVHIKDTMRKSTKK